jgi:DNA-binding CsgD family transcriptional regulator
MSEGLWERDSELATLAAALDTTAQGAGRLALVEGPAGVGKSRLLRAARELAATRGLAVLAARGTELERDVPFGLARQLFVPALLEAPRERRAELLAGPAALAAPLLGGSAAAADPVGEGQAGALVEGLYWLTVNLVRSRPGLALAVDDAQWADRSSLRFLLHVAGHLGEMGVCVLAGIRTGEPETPEDLLGRLRSLPGSLRVRPAPLSDRGVGELVREQGFAGAATEFCTACARVSGGNPFLLTELLAGLRADGVDPTAEAAQRVRELLPEAVLDTVAAGLRRLPPEAARLAGAVAVLDEAPVALAAELAGLEVPGAEAAADALAAAHLLAPGEPLSFVHPLIAAAVRADLPPLARARAHRRAAALLDGEGADVGRVAVHLLHTRPEGDAWAAAALRAAGRDALVHDEPQTAVRLLRRSLAEPPPEDQRDATLVELAQAEAAIDSADAVARLVEAVDRVQAPRQRAAAYQDLARLLFFKGDIAAAADAAERGLAELDPDDEMFSHLLSAQLTAATFDATLRGTVADRLGPFLAEARAGRPPSDPLVCAHLGARMAVAGDPAELVLPVAEGAFARHPLVDESAHGVVLAFPVVTLVIIDELDRALAVLTDALAAPRARRSLITQTVAHHWSATVRYRRGELVEAHAEAERALAACGTGDWVLYGPWIAANLAHVLLERGDVESAGAVLADDDAVVDPIGRCLGLEARGRLALARGDAAAAWARFTEAGRALDAMGLVNPGFVAWRSWAALAALRLGRRQEAAELAAAEVALARRAGAARPLGVALRAAGLAAAGDRSIPLLAEAVDVLARSAARLEQARAMVDLGGALRRSGQRSAAREPLGRALDLAARAGAAPLVEQARAELRAAGGRPRREHLTGVAALTPTERRIAELAARPSTSAQIAQELYVSTKTVEWHLANVYRKLDVSQRGQLADALR